MRFISLVPTFLLSLPIICPSVNALPRFSREILAQRGAHSGRVSTDLAVRENAFDLRQLANVKRSGDEENCGCQDGNGSSSAPSPTSGRPWPPVSPAPTHGTGGPGSGSGSSDPSHSVGTGEPWTPVSPAPTHGAGGPGSGSGSSDPSHSVGTGDPWTPVSPAPTHGAGSGSGPSDPSHSVGTGPSSPTSVVGWPGSAPSSAPSSVAGSGSGSGSPGSSTGAGWSGSGTGSGPPSSPLPSSGSSSASCPAGSEPGSGSDIIVNIPGVVDNDLNLGPGLNNLVNGISKDLGLSSLIHPGTLVSTKRSESCDCDGSGSSGTPPPPPTLPPTSPGDKPCPDDPSSPISSGSDIIANIPGLADTDLDLGTGMNNLVTGLSGELGLSSLIYPGTLVSAKRSENCDCDGSGSSGTPPPTSPPASPGDQPCPDDPSSPVSSGSDIIADIPGLDDTDLNLGAGLNNLVNGLSGSLGMSSLIHPGELVPAKRSTEIYTRIVGKRSRSLRV